MAKAPELLQFKREDFPSNGLSTGDALDRLFQPLNRFMDSVRLCLSKGIGVADNSYAEVRQLKVTMPATDWVALSLLNSWTNLAGYHARIRKDLAGNVWMQGVLTVPAGPPAQGSTICNLPSAAYALDFQAGDNGGQLCPGDQTDAWNEFRVTPSTGTPSSAIIVGFGPALVATDFFSIYGSWVAADRTPIVPSCFPLDFTLQRVQNPKAVLLAGVRDITTPANGGTSTDPPIALGVPKYTMLASNKVRVQNVPGLLYGKTYQLSFLVLG